MATLLINIIVVFVTYNEDGFNNPFFFAKDVESVYNALKRVCWLY